MRVKNIFKDIKLEIFNSIETFYFDLQNLIFHLCPIRLILKKIVLSGRIRHFKKIILKGRGLKWLGQENEENVAGTRNFCGWPSSPR